MKKLSFDKITRTGFLRLGISIYVILSFSYIISITLTTLNRTYFTQGMSYGRNEIINSILSKLEADPCYRIEVFHEEIKYTLKNVDCID